MNKSKETLLFLTRGNTIQIFDYESETVLKKVEFQDDEKHMNLTSFYSSTKKLYVTHGKQEIIMISTTDLESKLNFKVKNGTLMYFGFLDQQDKYCFYVLKQEAYYYIHLCELKNNELIELKTFKIKSFIRNFNYIQLSVSKKKFYVHKSPNRLNCYDLNTLEEFTKLDVNDEIPIHEFLVYGEFIYTTTNDYKKDDKNKSIVKVYRISDDINLVCKRSFKNVQELKMYNSKDFSIFIVQAHQYQDKTGQSYYGREKIFHYSYLLQKFQEIVTYKGVIHNLSIDENNSNLIVSSGKMPAHTILYDSVQKPLRIMCHDFKNKGFFSPNSKYLAMAGFGNLNGQIQIWRMKDIKLIGQCSSSFASFLKWSSNQKYFLTATVYEKLKEEHKLTIYETNGNILKKINFNICDLCNVDFVDQSDIKDEKEYPDIPYKIPSGGLLQSKLDNPGPITEEKIKNYSPEENKGPTLQVGMKKSNSKKDNTILNKWKTPLQRGGNFKKQDQKK